MIGAPTPLLTAVYRGDQAAVDTLLASGAMPSLCEAAALGDAARVRGLARAEPAALGQRSLDAWPALSQNAEGNTALHAALAGRGDLRIVSRLLASGADVNARAAGGYTPLHIAAFHDDVSLVNTLLAHGAAAEARDDQGRTPLTIAEAQGQPHVARRLRGEMP